jgi:type I restriction enzyme S subunit
VFHYIKGKFDFHQRVYKISDFKEGLDGYYFYLYFSNNFYNRIMQMTAKSSVDSVRMEMIADMKIPLPPTKAEQTAIATALSDADALIQSLEKLIAKNRNIKQGAMQELLKPKEGWVVKTLGEIGTFKKGKGIKKESVISDGFPCVRYGEIYTHHHEYIKQFNSFISSETAKESQLMYRGDLLFAGSGETKKEIGKCVAFLHDKEAYAGGDVIVLSPNGYDSLFLGFLLNHESVAKQRAQRAQGDAVVHIYPTNLSEIIISLPPTKNEQGHIATILFDMDAEISVLETKLAKYRQIKQGMMQNLLTGRIRLV